MSKPKAFPDRFHPRGEWVLFQRVFKKGGKIHTLDSTKKAGAHYDAVVIAHGPGEYQNGVFVKVEGLEPGTLIIVPANHCLQSERWEGHNLHVCPASSIVCTMDQGDDLELPEIIVPKMALVT